MHKLNCSCCPNPIVRVTALRAYRGWTVREYADGHFDAEDGKGLTPGFRSFAEVIEHLRAERHREMEHRIASARDWDATQNLIADMERDGLL